MDRKFEMTTLDETRAPPPDSEAKSQNGAPAENETTDCTPKSEDSKRLVNGKNTEEERKVALKAISCLDGSTILMVGLLLFLLVSMLPLLVLLASLGLAYLLPHWICTGNSGANRRRKANIDARSSSNRETFATDGGSTVEESYWFNERGMALFTKMFLPKDKEIRSILCYCHDNTDHDLDVTSTEPKQLVKGGVAYVYIQYEGHGRSDGPLNLIPSWEQLVGDIGAFYLATANKEMFRGKPMFLIGKVSFFSFAFLYPYQLFDYLTGETAFAYNHRV
jgi:hypothetical protein